MASIRAWSSSPSTSWAGKTFAPCFAPRYAPQMSPMVSEFPPDMPDQGEEIGGARVPRHQEEGEGDGLVDREIVSDQPDRMLKVNPLLLQAQGVPDLLPQEGILPPTSPQARARSSGDPARVW